MFLYGKCSIEHATERFQSTVVALSCKQGLSCHLYKYPNKMVSCVTFVLTHFHFLVVHLGLEQINTLSQVMSERMQVEAAQMWLTRENSFI